MESLFLINFRLFQNLKLMNSVLKFTGQQALQHISAFSLHSLAALHVLASLWNEDYLYNFSFSFYFDVNTISLSVVFSFTVRPFLAPKGAQTAIVSNNWSATWYRLMLMIPRNADVDDSDADTDDELLSEWSDKQIGMWADESFFLRYCKSFRTDSNLIRNFLFLKYCNFFSKPNWIRFGFFWA